MGCPGQIQHHGQELPRLGDGRVDRGPAPGHRTAAAHEYLGAQRGHRVEGSGRPLLMERVARVQRGLRLDEIPGEEHLVRGQPGDDVARGVPAPAVLQHQLAAVSAEVDGEPVAEGDVGPGEPGNGLAAGEQPRHPALLRRPVGLTSFGDEHPGLLVRDDHLRLERGRAQRPDRVVVAQHQILHRLVGVLAQLVEPAPGHERSRPGLERDDEVLALDRADVRVALGRQRVHPWSEDLEGLRLVARSADDANGLTIAASISIIEKVFPVS